MTLVDTSVSVDHFRAADSRLTGVLLDGQVMCHSFVVGGLACQERIHVPRRSAGHADLGAGSMADKSFIFYRMLLERM